MAILWKMNLWRPINEGKNNKEKSHWVFANWLPDRGGQLVGAHFIGEWLYKHLKCT